MKEKKIKYEPRKTKGSITIDKGNESPYKAKQVEKDGGKKNGK